MRRLREKDIEKLSALLGLPQYAIDQMASIHLIHEGQAIDMLVTYDWRHLRRSGMYKAKDLVLILAAEYGISEAKVKASIYKKRKHSHICKKCRKRMTKREDVENDGICDKCLAKATQL